MQILFIMEETQMKKFQTKLVASVLTVLLLFSLITVPSFAETAFVFSDWPSFRGSTDNIAVTSTKSARTADEAELIWSLALKDPLDWSINISDPITAENNIYIAVGNELLTIESDGGIAARTELAGFIDYTCRPVYEDGLIIVPISGGRLQALTADSMQTQWTTEALPAYEQDGLTYEHQTLTALTAQNGYIYYATACADYVTSYYGVVRCVQASTGDIIWSYENESAGYYWSGAVCYGGTVIIAGDDGILRSLDAAGGTELYQAELGAQVRSAAVLSGNQVFVTSADGKLHKITMRDDGSFENIENVQFAASSTSTPAVYNGKAVAGGHQGAENGYKGILAIIDTQTMTVTGKAELPAEVKSAPLISTGHSGEAYAYFTSNTEPGGIYALKLESSEAQAIFTPEGADANYCVASILADESGTLYYTNDSGKLFAVAYHETPVTSEPADPSSYPSSLETSSDTGSNVESRITAEAGVSQPGGIGAKSQNPKTSDSSVLFIIIILLSSSLFAAVMLRPKKKAH
ncbi:MAG TPA: hypothetical protein DEQ02_07280 [Ruminococcaceae bacterium]|nr:hypothetical protein [Oscillospiraceae bacterium]